MDGQTTSIRPIALRLDVDRLCDDLRGAGWSVHPGALDAESCARLRETAQRLRGEGAFRPAGVGRGRAWRLDPALRGDEVLWLDPVAATPCETGLLGCFDALGIELNRRLYLGIADYEAHLAVYPPGRAYRRHRDHFIGTCARIVTTTLYLNDDWTDEDGGHIRLFVPDGDPLEIAPTGGTLVTFLSRELEHEVLPARRARWSWTGWFRRVRRGVAADGRRDRGVHSSRI